MKEFMNPPVYHEHTDEDIIKEYVKYGDIKTIAARYLISTKEVRNIIKRAGLM